MTGQRSVRSAVIRTPSARSSLALIAALLALGASLSAPFVQSAEAASDSLFEGTATYTADPGGRATHVAVDVKFTNRKRATSTLIYLFDGLKMGVQPEATNIKVTDSTGALKFTKKHTDSFTKGDVIYFPGTELKIDFRRDLLYGQTAKFRVSYDLAGSPRSSSPVRVGQAFATFPVWPYGDDGHSKVKVILPAGFQPRIDGYPLSVATADDGRIVLTGDPPKLENGWSLISATRPDRYATNLLDLGPDLDVRLESFPEDTGWTSAVKDLLGRAGPRLRDLIGMPPPTGAGPIVVRERYELDLDTVKKLGFAPTGAWTADPLIKDREVALGESTDALAILGRFAEAWFADGFFGRRWIAAGLSTEYAAQVLAQLGQDPGAPEKPAQDAKGRQPLESWGFPRLPTASDYRSAVPPIADGERYGRDASWYVVHQLAKAAGPDAMRTILERVTNDQIAYVGAGAPEKVDTDDDWQRLLDLVQEVGGVTDAEQVFQDLVLTTSQISRLDARAAARDAYRGLIGASDGWLPPLYVRQPLDAWLFDSAQARITDARTALTLRSEVETKASGAGVTTGPSLKALYESATDGFGPFTDAANASLAALASISQARGDLDAERDIFTQVGLYGQRPEDGYAAAEAAFEADDAAGAQAAAQGVSATIAGAADVGRQRVMYAAGGVAAVLILILLAIIVWRRRRRPPVAVTVEAPAPVDQDRIEVV